MRLVIISLAVLVAVPAVAADKKADDRERKVKVALALAAAAQCGDCKFDEAGCRTEAAKAGKPLVLFVGGPACNKCGGVVKAAGGVPCVVESYDGDKMGTKPRAVVLMPKPAGGWWIESTLTGYTPDHIKAAVAKAKAPPAAPLPVEPPPLNWKF